ncbi:MAG TPA: POTRA domain-containing protein [Vicinamibacterales bacterium]
MMRALRWLALATVLAAASAGPAAAQSRGLLAPPSLVGRPVTTQVVAVEGRPVTEGGLLDLVQTRPGEPLTVEDVRETIAHFAGLGRFEDVVVQAHEEPGGVRVSYELVPVRLIRRLEFQGRVELSSRLLRSRVADRLGDVFSRARLDEMVRALEAVYQDHGYMEARILPRPDLPSADRETLVVEIEAGPRLTISRVTVDGNAPMPLTEIPRITGLSAGQPYRRAEVDRRLAKLVEDLRDRGYYEARADHVLEPDPDGRTAELAIAVDAGARIQVLFEGDALPEGDRQALVPVEREGSADEDLLEDSAIRIRDRLRAEGYRDASVEYARMPRGEELAVVFTVDRGPRYRTGTVRIEGAATLPAPELEPLLRTRAGDPFVQAAVDRDAAAIVEYYRRRGFTDVRVSAEALPAAGAAEPVPVDVRFAVEEGPRTLVGDIAIRGAQAVDPAALRAAVSSRPGQPYYQPQVAIDRDGMQLVLLNLGYPSAAVDARVTFSPDRSRADLEFSVSEGPQVFVGHVLVVGNEKTDARTIRREVTLEPGAPLSYAQIMESQSRISALGLFRRVRITELDHGVPNERDLLVSVEEAPATTVGYGAGLEAGPRLRRSEPGGPATEVFEVAPRGFVEYGRRNLFGRNQSINLFGRASLRSRASTVDVGPGEEEPGGYTLRDYRALGTFRSPRVFGTEADLVLTGFLEQGLRSSFNFTRRGARAELARRLTRSLSVSGRYLIERTKLFEERFDPSDKPLVDRLFPQLRISTLSAAVVYDTRDDLLTPTNGVLIGFDQDVAMRAIGSEVGFVKGFGQAFVYRRLPGARGTVFAAGARIGLARGFEHVVPLLDEAGDPILDENGEPVVDVVTDLPASERFFAGGDTTVRGYALDRLGTPETIDRNGFPTGGHAVAILNSELRIPVWGGLGAVGFVDAGNVFSRVSDFSVGRLKPTAGLGIRYQSPIGPIRVDVGFKLRRERLRTGELESRAVLHISLGQAF